MFPVLDAAQIETARRFASGPDRRFEPGVFVYRIGDRGASAWLVLDGTIDVVRRDGLSHVAPFTTHHTGQLTGEISQLAGRPSIASGQAGPGGCTALPFDPPHLRALMVGSAEIGEIVMRALILRRVGLIEEGGAGTILIGVPGSSDVVRLQGFLTRGANPNLVLDSGSDAEGRALVERTGLQPEELPLIVCPDGTLLRNPSNQELATCLGIAPELDPGAVFDVAIVGAGPAGLAAAVYAASEGLSTIVLDERAVGGQAGASNRIENYLGFPTGISGLALAGRAHNQALKFGAEVAVPLTALGLCRSDDRTPGELLALSLPEGQHIQARSIIIASGARYRRPDIHDLAAFEGRGVSYWVSQIEAKLCAGEEVALVGGGNSAGQAVAFLAPQVRRLHLIVRRALASTMSQYLVDRLSALPNLAIHVNASITRLEGDRASGLTGVQFRKADGSESWLAVKHLFLFTGADPNAGWLDGCVETDDKGFVVTGRGTLPLETSLPGVFAIGDVRSGSTKRVAAAVGEGAAVVSQIHAAIAARAKGMT